MASSINIALNCNKKGNNSMIPEILLACSTMVHTETLDALVKTESHYNPYAIAVVDGKPVKQPKTKAEAEQTIEYLEAKGLNYSVGLGQVNKTNFAKYGVTGKDLLDSCTNIKTSEKILAACYAESPNKSVAEALSCYYAGNFSYGFVRERKSGLDTSYVERVIENVKGKEEIVVPSIKGEIPQALAKVREPKTKVQQKKAVKPQPITVIAANDNFSQTGRLIKNRPKPEATSNESQNRGSESVSKTFKF